MNSVLRPVPGVIDQSTARRWDGLKTHVMAQPTAQALTRRLAEWVVDDRLAEYQDAATGALRGNASRDLGDITPFLWLLDGQDDIDRLHARAGIETVDGLLVEDQHVRSFDNHDYTLSFYLLYQLTEEEKWRRRFLERCRSIQQWFFGAGAMPPARVSVEARPSLKRAPTAYGLLELLCLAQRIDPDGNWTAFVADQLPAISAVLDKQPLPLIPRTAAERFGMVVYNPKPGRPWTRLFKDNSNLIFALLTYLQISGDETAVPLLRRIIGAVDETLLDEEAGWAFTEVWQRGGRSRPGSPLLVGNTIAIELCRAVRAIPALAGALDPAQAMVFIDEPLQEAAQEGLVPMAPGADVQHVDMMVDFVTTVVLWLAGTGDKETATEVLAHGVAALSRHETGRGLATLAGREGPRGEVCVKYNFLAVKLAVCGYLLAHGDVLSPADRAFIADVFLIDR